MKKKLPLPHLKVEVEGSSELDPQKLTFPVVGIGSSAGGLVALEIFFRNVPLRNGIAFVIVQHLDPTHKGIMVELLQRYTDMEVVQVSDRLPIEKDHIYVIPPNKEMYSLVFSEKEVSASYGRWFVVKIMPYRTQENRIVGLVITFTDITTAKKL